MAVDGLVTLAMPSCLTNACRVLAARCSRHFSPALTRLVRDAGRSRTWDRSPPDPDVQLTFNVDQDYWPAWTTDGRGILYAYVDRERPLHRCLGLLPATGGTRLWQLCDNRAVRDDSASSYGAFALDSAGRLLVAETVSSANAGATALSQTTLWLADSAHPYVRTSLLTLPLTVGTTVVTWLADISWTGPNTFIALGQQFSSEPHCIGPGLSMVCPSRDSIWADTGGVVVRGYDCREPCQSPCRRSLARKARPPYSLAENGAS